MNTSQKRIVDYYTQSNVDYQWIWRLDRYLAIHYGFYDRTSRTHGKAVLNFNKVIAETAKIKSSDLVLDAGCGIGGTSIWLAKNIGCRVVGISLSEQQVSKAKNLALKNNVSHLVEFRVEDYTKTSFNNETFDAIYGLESICYAQNKKDFIEEAWRLLKNDGRLVVADGFLSKSLDPKWNNLKKWLDGWAVPNLSSIDSFSDDLSAAGFTQSNYRNVTKNIMPSSKNLYYATIATYPFALVMKLLGLRNDIQMNNMKAAFWQHVYLRKNLWEYGIFSAKKLDS